MPVAQYQPYQASAARTPGGDGAALSPIVAGAWRMTEWGWTPQQRLRWIEHALELGITSFDHADIYGDYGVESLFGEALALHPALRDKLQLVDKCGIKLVSARRPAHRIKSYDTSRAHIVASVEASLRALRTDRLDLLLIHRPDALMDAAEVAETFAMLGRQGKVLRFGVSNFMPWQFELLDTAMNAHGGRLVTNQIELHPLRLEPLHDGTLDQAQRLGRRPMIWSPLAGGRLVSTPPLNDAARRVQETLRGLAEVHGVAPTTIAVAWLLRHPSRPMPVMGSRRVDVLREAVAALDLTLDRESWYALWQAGRGHEVP
ncbi:MAG TPA: aldo/keto reductase [Burkholderiaceae bacterium]|nr:aldo/keto reductase [Burkholderiaceae bacterium]